MEERARAAETECVSDVLAHTPGIALTPVLTPPRVGVPAPRTRVIASDLELQEGTPSGIIAFEVEVKIQPKLRLLHPKV